MRHSKPLTNTALMDIAITDTVNMVMQARVNSPVITAVTATAHMGIRARTAIIRNSRIMVTTGTAATANTLPTIATTAPGIAKPEPIIVRTNLPIAVIMAKVLAELLDVMSSLAGPIAGNAAAIPVPLLVGMTVTTSSQASVSTTALLPDRTVIGDMVIGRALPDRMPVQVQGPVLAPTITGVSRNSNEKLTTCFGWSPKCGKR
jgi:hypothetical protein